MQPPDSTACGTGPVCEGASAVWITFTTAAHQAIRPADNACSRSVDHRPAGLVVRSGMAVRGQTFYVTNHGRRIAAIVPVPVAEQVENRQI